MTCKRCKGKREVILYRLEGIRGATEAVWGPCPECKGKADD